MQNVDDGAWAPRQDTLKYQEICSLDQRQNTTLALTVRHVGLPSNFLQDASYEVLQPDPSLRQQEMCQRCNSLGTRVTGA